MKLHLPDNARTSADPIADILQNSEIIAVVGLSSDRSRPSYGVSQYLQSKGYRIIPVNPNETEVLGEKAYARLEDVPQRIDIVDVFRRTEAVPPVADSAVAVGAKVLWMQLGIINQAAAEKARAAGLMVIEDACLLIEHKRHTRRAPQSGESH
jgi:uncharacterized protein